MDDASANFGFSSQNWIPSDEFLNRIRRAYRIGLDRYHQPADTMWSKIDETHRIEVHNALISDNHSRLRELLSDPAKTGLNFGLDTLSSISVVPLKSNPQVRAGVGQTITDQIGSLLDTIGARRVANREARTVSEVVSGDHFLHELDKRMGFHVPFPSPFADEFGMRTERGLIAFKVPMALDQVYRLSCVSKILGGDKVLEIGPGVGRTAFYARCAGLTNYTTVDTPLGIIAQSCWLEASWAQTRFGSPATRIS